jgi:hypothetical protein
LAKYTEPAILDKSRDAIHLPISVGDVVDKSGRGGGGGGLFQAHAVVLQSKNEHHRHVAINKNKCYYSVSGNTAGHNQQQNDFHHFFQLGSCETENSSDLIDSTARLFIRIRPIVN